MKIWYLHQHSTPYEIAGVHRPFEFGEYFQNKGHKLTVFCGSFLHFGGYDMIKDKSRYKIMNFGGIDTVYVKTSSYKGSGFKRVLNMIQFWKRLPHVGKKIEKAAGKPDIIIASSPQPLTMLAGLKMAKKYKVPCICEIRDFWPEVFFLSGVVKERSLLGKILLRGERYIYEKADELVFLKEGDHTYITDEGWDKGHGGKIDMSKCAYINNGVDIKRFDNDRKKFPYQDGDLDNGKFNVVYCGSIRPVNNINMVLKAAKLVPEAQFLIYGSGSCEEELKKKVEDEKISNVKMKGYVDNKYVASILHKSSLNLLNYSSQKYNWSRGNSSNKLFEYLASGKPVLSTVKMGYDILERYHCGLSTEETTPEAIANKIKRMMAMSREDYQKMASNARRAAEEFDIPKLADEYLELMNGLLKKEKPKGE